LKHSYFNIVLLLFVLFAACHSKSKKELIVNKWKCEKLEFADSTNKAVSEKNDLQLAEAFLRNATYEFFGDGTFETVLNKEVKKGTYTLSENEKDLLMVYNLGKSKKEKWEIIDITEGQMQLKFTSKIPVVFTFIVYTEKF